MLFPNSGQAVDAVESGAVDVSFMPVDEERRERIAFGPDYVRAESTYMVTAASGAKTVEDVDKPGMRVIGIANTTTIRAATRTLKNTTISPVTSVGDAVAMLRDGKADAFALGRDSLPPYVKQVPGSRMTDGQFQQIGIAIATRRASRRRSPRITDFMNARRRTARCAARSTEAGSRTRSRRSSGHLRRRRSAREAMAPRLAGSASFETRVLAPRSSGRRQRFAQ